MEGGNRYTYIKFKMKSAAADRKGDDSMRKLNAEKLERVLKERVSEDIKWGRVAGAAMMVSQCGEIVCDMRLGTKNAETGEPLVPHTIFRLASMTKPITGVACLIAIERGWLDLYDNVADYFPEVKDMYVGRIENGKVVPDHKPHSDMKIYQLLSHCNGIMAETPIGNLQGEEMPYSAYETNKTMVDYCINNTCLAFDPAEYSAYTGYVSFDMVARIIEEKSGMCYADFLDENIFKPLGIKDITFFPTEAQWDRMIAMHDRRSGGKMITVNMGRENIFEGFPLNYTCAGAGIAGSIEDYRIFAEMLRCNGEYNGVRIFAPELLKLMKTPYVPDGTPGRSETDSWGLGVRVAVHNPVLPAGTFGWSGAYGTHFWVDQENEITAVYMKNNRWYDSHGCGLTGINFEKDVMSALE
ncbi:MAG: beta-lactamase family protein [Ruminococcaceae bacterium]|nr:beta-lactamase family protein [Oscillospiraceae bacterium]